MECIRDAFKQLKEVIHDVGITSQDVSGKVTVCKVKAGRMAAGKVPAGEAKEVEIAVEDNHTFEESNPSGVPDENPASSRCGQRRMRA